MDPVVQIMIAIFGLIGMSVVLQEFTKRFFAYREKKLELLESRKSAQIERLEARLRVLEKIATDKGVQLADEIEDLRGSEAELVNQANEENG